MFRMHEKIKKNEVYIIAEMSANHAGDINNAYKIIREAASAGADCVKIQTYTADTLTIDCDKEDFKIKGGLWDGNTLYSLYEEAYTPWEWQADLKAECERCGVDFLSTPFDKTAVDFLEEIGVEAYKIASYELVDIPLIKYAASKGKTMIISCGMGSKEEIEEAIEACRSVGNDDIVLLKCCSEYPAVIEDMNLSLIRKMEEDFGVPIGLSDHSEGFFADELAVAAGAKIIEKHVCISKDIKNPDSDFSMEMVEFKKMIDRIGTVSTIMGKAKYELTRREEEGKSGRRSLYLVENIKAGEKFTEDNVRSIRPSFGLKPKYIDSIIGRTAKADYVRGTALRWDMVN